MPRNDAALTADDIKRHCAEQLVIYKVPAEVRIVERLPVTGAQKLDRMALRKLAAG